MINRIVVIRYASFVTFDTSIEMNYTGIYVKIIYFAIFAIPKEFSSFTGRQPVILLSSVCIIYAFEVYLLILSLHCVLSQYVRNAQRSL